MNRIKREKKEEYLERLTKRSISMINKLKNIEDEINDSWSRELDGLEWAQALRKIGNGVFNKAYMRRDELKYCIEFNNWERTKIEKELKAYTEI